MRSLNPRIIPTSTISALQIPRPYTGYTGTLHEEGIRRRSTVLQLALKDLANQENFTETESTVILGGKTLEDNDEHIEIDKLSSSEVKQSQDITSESKQGVETNDSAPSFLGMTPNAIFALNSVAIIWGTQHAIIKLVVDDADAGQFTLLRFAIGAVIASLPLLIKKSRADTTEHPVALTMMLEDSSSGSSEISEQQQSSTKEDGNIKAIWRWGAEMGFWMFLGFAFQAIGLATTTAQRSGFLLYLNVKFVPFFAFLLFGRKISITTVVSALTAFGGTALLAYDGASWSLNQGDWWSIAAAASSALYILRLDTAAKEVGEGNSIQLNAACLWVVTLLSGFWSVGAIEDASLLGQQLLDIVTSHPIEIVYLSAVTTALANYIQTKSQKEISAERASVIYAMDPVYGAVVSNLLLGETLTSLGFVGAGLITAAAATNAFLELGANNEEAKTGKSQ